MFEAKVRDLFSDGFPLLQEDKVKNHRILIAVATLGRPQMLEQLLASLVIVKTPERANMEILVVENSAEITVFPQVNRALGLNPDVAINVINEPTRGVASARNAALDYAFQNAFDWLAFIDDDETASPDWLVKLFASALDRGLDVCGGYVYPVAPQGELSYLQRRLLKGLIENAGATHERLKEKVNAGKDARSYICTSNWMCNLASARKASVRFREEMNFSGGEDMRFSEDMLAFGMRLGRVPDAITYETVPGTRLTLTYIFSRERDNEKTNVYRRFTVHGRRIYLRAIVFALGKFIRSASLIFVSPIYGFSAVCDSVGAFGSGIGRLEGALGIKSSHYKKIHGY